MPVQSTRPKLPDTNPSENQSESGWSFYDDRDGVERDAFEEPGVDKDPVTIEEILGPAPPSVNIEDVYLLVSADRLNIPDLLSDYGSLSLATLSNRLLVQSTGVTDPLKAYQARRIRHMLLESLWFLKILDQKVNLPLNCHHEQPFDLTGANAHPSDSAPSDNPSSQTPFTEAYPEENALTPTNDILQNYPSSVPPLEFVPDEAFHSTVIAKLKSTYNCALISYLVTPFPIPLIFNINENFPHSF